MDPFYAADIAILGLVIGSFLTVVIYRLPRGTLFKHARSVCPQCGHQLKLRHMIPIISHIVLRGRCAFCGARIPIRYSLVPALNAGLYVYFYYAFGITYLSAIYALLASTLLVIFFIDLDHQIIPDSLTIPGMVLGVVASRIPGSIGLVNSLIGLLVGGVALLAIALLGDWLFKKESMGGGDIKMAAMLGAFLGWQKVLLVFVMSAVIGLLVSIALLTVSERLRREHLIPFGPFLSAAAVLAIAWGDHLIAFYSRHFLGF